MAEKHSQLVNMQSSFQLPYAELLNEQERQLLYERSNEVTYDAKEIIFHQGSRSSHIMYLKEGLVKVFKTNRQKKSVILKIIPPGNYFGLISVFGSEIHQYSAACVEPSVIVDIDINAFRSVLTGNGHYATKLLTKVSQDGLFIFDRLMAQTHKQLPGRIADVLLYFAETIYGSTSYTLPLTRKELAELAGTTKESFIRTLMEFKRDRIINLEGSKVEIVSMKIVETLSNLG